MHRVPSIPFDLRQLSKNLDGKIHLLRPTYFKDLAGGLLEGEHRRRKFDKYSLVAEREEDKVAQKFLLGEEGLGALRVARGPMSEERRTRGGLEEEGGRRTRSLAHGE